MSTHIPGSDVSKINDNAGKNLSEFLMIHFRRKRSYTIFQIIRWIF